MYGPTSRFEFHLLVLRTWLRQEKNYMKVASVVFYVVAGGMIALVVVPR